MAVLQLLPVFLAAYHRYSSIRLQSTDIADVQPAIFVEHLFSQLWVLVVALEDRVAFDMDQSHSGFFELNRILPANTITVEVWDLFEMHPEAG